MMYSLEASQTSASTVGLTITLVGTEVWRRPHFDYYGGIFVWHDVWLQQHLLEPPSLPCSLIREEEGARVFRFCHTGIVTSPCEANQVTICRVLTEDLIRFLRRHDLTTVLGDEILPVPSLGLVAGRCCVDLTDKANAQQHECNNHQDCNFIIVHHIDTFMSFVFCTIVPRLRDSVSHPKTVETNDRTSF